MFFLLNYISSPSTDLAHTAGPENSIKLMDRTRRYIIQKYLRESRSVRPGKTSVVLIHVQNTHNLLGDIIQNTLINHFHKESEKKNALLFWPFSRLD